MQRKEDLMNKKCDFALCRIHFAPMHMHGCKVYAEICFILWL